MKKILFVFFISISATCFAQDISLFNSEGDAVAYIDTEDDDLTIYLWDGRPVCYLYSSNGDYHVYGFNGTHLGWFIEGIIRDHEGNAVGVTKKATTMFTNFEPFKSFKSFKPFKSFKEFAPFQPFLSSSFGATNFKLFLLKGI